MINSKKYNPSIFSFSTAKAEELGGNKLLVLI
jgi:hypothetical protein